VTLLTNSSVNEDFFAVFWTRLTNVLVDARANINIKHERSGHSRREVQSTLDTFLTSLLAKRQRPATEEEETYFKNFQNLEEE